MSKWKTVYKSHEPLWIPLDEFDEPDYEVIEAD